MLCFLEQRNKLETQLDEGVLLMVMSDKKTPLCVFPEIMDKQKFNFICGTLWVLHENT